MTPRIRRLTSADPPVIAAAFKALGWDKPVSLYERYLAEQNAEDRLVLVAETEDSAEIAGYLTVVWASSYPPFAADGIPEIVDLNVLPEYRCRGIGSTLLDAAEALVATRSGIVGIGVGLSADYGPAQGLYVRRGYVPDGRGVVRHGAVVGPGAQVPIDDDTVLMFTRQLRGADPVSDAR